MARAKNTCRPRRDRLHDVVAEVCDLGRFQLPESPASQRPATEDAYKRAGMVRPQGIVEIPLNRLQMPVPESMVGVSALGYLDLPRNLAMSRFKTAFRVFPIVILLAAVPGFSAELARLNSENWDEFAPEGKEVDCIYGDIVMRNDRLTVVIANPAEGRNANMTVKDVAGCIIDLTVNDNQSDQLSAFYPGARAYQLNRAELPEAATDGGTATSETVEVTCKSATVDGKPMLHVTYSLRDGDPFVKVTSTFKNPHDETMSFALEDAVRADRSFESGVDANRNLGWFYDKWFGQAYGVLPDEHEIRAGETQSGRNPSLLQYVADDDNIIDLGPDEEHTLVRYIFPGRTLFDIHRVPEAVLGLPTASASVYVADAAGPIADADVILTPQGYEKPSAWGRTDGDGRIAVHGSRGTYNLLVKANGRPEVVQEVQLPAEADIKISMEQPGYVVAKITDEDGGPVPCKVQFRGRDRTEDPFFFIDSGEHAVQNLYYSHNGQFRQEIAPGEYDVIISRGPEYDAVFTQITVKRGEETGLSANLVRSVDAPGWVSSDFHSHSSPSGDNTSSQYGRVLNLLCEHIEFAPCTEHNRISTYVPHLEKMGVRGLMATCCGMELTGSPLPVNHQNAFPLIHTPRTQDGGAPQTDTNPEVQIERLAMWDDNSDKLVQGNHPNIVQIYGDRDLNREPDQGFHRMFGFMDVIEVHPPHEILTPAASAAGARNQPRSTIFHWLQLLNLGHRIPGVVNTDAHYNFHGSGFLRNYIKSPTDDPAEVDTMEMVHAAEKGNMIMTNGPFLEVSLTAGSGETRSSGTAGDDVSAPDGNAQLDIRVQCPNWFDIDRVQVLINGRPSEDHNYQRRTDAGKFSTGTVKFDQSVSLSLSGDAHVIVVAAGEQSRLGPVMGPAHENDIPVAVCNPIFVDVDGNGFQANKDDLDMPLERAD